MTKCVNANSVIYLKLADIWMREINAIDLKSCTLVKPMASLFNRTSQHTSPYPVTMSLQAEFIFTMTSDAMCL